MLNCQLCLFLCHYFLLEDLDDVISFKIMINICFLLIFSTLIGVTCILFRTSFKAIEYFINNVLFSIVRHWILLH